MRYHAKNALAAGGATPWVYEARDCTLEATSMQLVRILIGKVEKKDRLESVMSSVPIVQDDEEWNCVIWVKEAMARLKADGKAMGTSQLEWQTVRDAAMSYVQQKKDQHRFDGRGNFNTSSPATYDLLDGKETIP